MNTTTIEQPIKNLYAHHYSDVSGKPYAQDKRQARFKFGKEALLVRCGSQIFDVSDSPEVYHELAH